MSEKDTKSTDEPTITDLPDWLAGLENPRKTFTLYLHPRAWEWMEAKAEFDILAEQIRTRDDVTEAALGDEDPMMERLQDRHDLIEELTPAVRESGRGFELERRLTDGEINDINRRYVTGSGDDARFDSDSATIEHLERTYVGDDAMTPAGWRKVQRFVGVLQWNAFVDDVSRFFAGQVVTTDFSLPGWPSNRE